MTDPSKEFKLALLSNRVANRFAMEFNSKKELANYLKEHPDADRSNHTVKKQAPKSPAKDKPKDKPKTKSEEKPVSKPKTRFTERAENALKSKELWGWSNDSEIKEFLNKFNELPVEEQMEMSHRLSDEDGPESPEELAREFFKSNKKWERHPGFKGDE